MTTATTHTRTDRIVHAVVETIIDFIAWTIGVAITGLLVWMLVWVLNDWNPAIPRMPYLTAFAVAACVRGYHRLFQVTTDKADRKTRRAA